MARKKLTEAELLERQHRRMFGNDEEGLRDNESLEQPYLGEVVDSVTTYSVQEESQQERLIGFTQDAELE